jgi:hypothetical protein
VKALLTVMMAGVIFGGVFAGTAEADDRRGKRDRDARYSRVYRDDNRGYRGDDRRYRDDDRDYRRYRNNRYFRGRDIVVVRDYYRPYYRPVPRPYRYYRGGYLPIGWRTRVVPVPVYYEPHFVPVPRGYHRGFIDGHVAIYNSRGFILDIAAVF